MNSTNKIAWFGTRLFIVLLFSPVYQNELFAPFLVNASHNFLDPWDSWVNSGGRTDAFPYGPLMYGILGFSAVLTKILNSMTAAIAPATIATISISIFLLFLDYFSSKYISAKVGGSRLSQILICIAPLPIYISYIYGQNDIIPSICILLICSQALNGSWKKVGILSGLGVCIKFSLILVIPFLFVYFISRKQIKNAIMFFSTFLPTALIALVPIMWSNGYYEMAIRSPEFINSLDFAIQIGEQKIYLMPVGYLAALLSFWSLPRVTPKILNSYIALSFLTVASLQSRSIGWFFWGYLLILISILKMRNRLIALFFIWQIVLVAFYGYRRESINLRFFTNFEWGANSIILSLLFTITIVVSFILILKLLVELNLHLDPFALGKKPISIAIAGDSGVGKDTLVNAISSLLSDARLAVLLGDDYHLGERQDPIWKNRTHLNISANDLGRWNRDVKLIMNRNKALARRYNHTNGRFTSSRVIDAGDFVILNGLHSLLLSEVKNFDIKIFLSMEESMRVGMKINRDFSERGSADKEVAVEKIRKRMPDFKKFVLVQKESADLVIEISSVSESKQRGIRYQIQSLDEALLHETYRLFHSFEPNLASLHVEVGGKSILTLNPEYFSSTAYRVILRKLIPNLDDLVANPNFEVIDSSILALVVISHCTRRREYSYDQ